MCKGSETRLRVPTYEVYPIKNFIFWCLVNPTQTTAKTTTFRDKIAS